MTDDLLGLGAELRKAAYCLSCYDNGAVELVGVKCPLNHNRYVLPAVFVGKEMRQIKEEVLSVEGDNPYPADIFPDRGLNKKAADLLYANRISPDNVFGNWGRKVWQNCCDKLKEKVEEALR